MKENTLPPKLDGYDKLDCAEHGGFCFVLRCECGATIDARAGGYRKWQNEHRSHLPKEK